MIATVPADTLQLTISEQAAVERLLNAYIRETGLTTPRMLSEQLPLLPPQLYARLSALGTPFCLRLADTLLLGALTYSSAIGQHQFAPQFWIGHSYQSAYRQAHSVAEIASLIIGAVSARVPVSAGQASVAQQHALMQHIENSLAKTAYYVEQRGQRNLPGLDLDTDDRMMRAEQALIFGHPFHPTPKSSEGWAAADLDRYAPELGATFQLHYFAAAPEISAEEWLVEHDSTVLPAEVIAAAYAQINGKRGWRVLPCHPWQAAYLCRLPEVRSLLSADRLRYLGPIGRPVVPTSSVRTVWEPEQDVFFKLPLNIRITNLVRVNPLDQLQRALDTSRVVDRIAREVPAATCTILRELGYRTILPAAWTEDRSAALGASFGVLFRRSPSAPGSSAPIVLAALLEPQIDGQEPPLIAALRRAAQGRALTTQFIHCWLERYLQVAFVPLLRWFLLCGVSLEAHVQNSMLALDKGWPSRIYVRDLEGASISRDVARSRSFYDGLLREDSPALYNPDEAWSRFKYYVVVNHLGHVLATVARYTTGDERDLWQVARALLQREAARYDGAALAYILDLLDEPELPAKANLISRFAERGETPLYVPIPNLLNAYKDDR